MNISECVKELQQNRKLSNNDEIRKFEHAVKSIMSTDKINCLYYGFDDETEDEEVMFGLIHAIESYYGKIDKEVYFSIFIDETQEIVNEAREWVKLMNIRILNDNESLEAYIVTAKKYKNMVKNLLEGIIKEIITEDAELFTKPATKFINGIK